MSLRIARAVCKRLAEEKPYGWRAKPTDARVDLPEYDVVVGFDDHMSLYRVSRRVLQGLPRDASAEDIKDTLLNATKEIVDADEDTPGIFLVVSEDDADTTGFFEELAGAGIDDDLPAL